MNMKIKFIAPIAALAAAGLLTGCNPDRLEIPQKGAVSTETFYKTDEDAEAALVAAYQGFLWNVTCQNGGSLYIPFVMAMNLCGDDVNAAGANYGDNDWMPMVNEFRFDTSNETIRNTYNGLYYAVYYTNLITDHFQYGTSDIKDRVISEARVLRAYIHMMLALGWGTPPLVDHVLAGDALPYNCNTDPNLGGMDQAGLLKWCAKECEESLEHLDDRQGPGDKDGAVKVTTGFANALAGKAYFYAGDYENARRCLKAVIDSKNYQLVPSDRWFDNFHIEGDANEEKIFETNIENNTNLAYGDYRNRTGWMMSQYWNWRTDHFVADVVTPYCSIEGWGGCGVPADFAEEFVAYHKDNSARLNGSIINIEDLVYETQYQTPNDDLNSLTREQKAASDRVGITAEGLYGQSFYLPLKPIVKTTDLRNPKENVRLNNTIVMRYPEVILLYAEACLPENGGTPEDAWQLVRELQDRAGVKDEYLVNSAADLTLDVIKKEKKFELWLEGCRWFDIRRWKDAGYESLKTQGTDIPVLYDKFTREPQATDENVRWQYGNEENSRFYIVDTHIAQDNGAVVGFKDGKHELFPFPYTATSINPNLTQNPGWTD